MGFLRKVGRKVKKGVKKLLGGKFGKILGGIGLSMMFLGGANAMFGKMDWFKGLKTNLNKINPFAKGDITSAVEVAGNTVADTVGTGAVVSPSTVPKLKLTDTPFSDLGAVDKIKKVGVETKEFLLPKDSTFVGDVTRSVGTNLALQAVQGEPVDEGGYGIMPNVGSMEAPQAQYVQAIRNDIPNFQATNFQQLNQSLLYGTLSPQYLMGQYQS